MVMEDSIFLVPSIGDVTYHMEYRFFQNRFQNCIKLFYTILFHCYMAAAVVITAMMRGHAQLLDNYSVQCFLTRAVCC